MASLESPDYTIYATLFRTYIQSLSLLFYCGISFAQDETCGDDYDLLRVNEHIFTVEDLVSDCDFQPVIRFSEEQDTNGSYSP